MEEPTINRGYVYGQLAQAFATARGHDDEGTRARAERKVERWVSVLKGMASGDLRFGSRTPVKDMPAWVTPEVLRGGFATGDAAASGPCEPWEAPDRAAAFAQALTEAGVGELDALLDSGAYAVDLPEQAALLTVAWLAGAGELAAAMRLVEELAPFAGELRFLPRPAEPDPTGPSVVWRRTAGETTASLDRRAPNPRLAAMRETLTVWNPFADELLSHWLETVVDGRVAAHYPEGWRKRGRALLDRYDDLALTFKLTTKHRRRKENLAILRIALTESVHGPLSPRRRGLLQHTVDSMLARRGAPGSPEHARLRAIQASVVAVPTHHALARVVVGRLAEFAPERGIEATESLLADVDGTPVPRSIRRVVERALAAEPEVLIERGIVPSAEVLAELVPPIAAATTALAYGDARLAALMAANYEAFRRRRSLLLLNLEHQVRVDELPWVRAVAAFKSGGAEAEASAAFRRLAELAVDAFPATLVPNALISELDVLAREAGLDLPLTEEIAADIFMGEFSKKFLRAAKIAAGLLEGTSYAEHYEIDYAAIRAMDGGFDELCIRRAGTSPGGVRANRRVIAQSQILTTHNLAALVSAGVELDYERLAQRVRDRIPRLERKPWQADHARRQLAFFEALTGK